MRITNDDPFIDGSLTDGSFVAGVTRTLMTVFWVKYKRRLVYSDWKLKLVSVSFQKGFFFEIIRRVIERGKSIIENVYRDIMEKK